MTTDIFLVVDAQVGFAHKVPDITDGINRALRNLDTGTVAVFTQLHNWSDSMFVRNPNYTEMMVGSEEILLRVTPPKGSFVLEKHQYSAAPSLFRKFGQEISVKMCGFNLNASMLSTAFDLWDAQIEFQVIKDLSYCQSDYRDAVLDLYRRQFGIDSVW